MIIPAVQATTQTRENLFRDIVREFSFPVNTQRVIRETINGQSCLLYVFGGRAVAGVGWIVTMLPTGERVLAEMMLYVSPTYRGSSFGQELLEALDKVAREERCDAIIAGSSLGHNEEAGLTYSKAGFRTTLSFRKDLNNV